MNEKIGVLLNTIPLMQNKAGVGYCVHNLYMRAKHHTDLAIYPAHQLRQGVIKMDRILRIISSPFKMILKDGYPKRLAAGIYNMFITPSIVISQYKLKKIISSLHIYHETRHVLIQEMLPYLGSIKLISDIHDLSPLLYPQWHLPEHVREVEKSIQKIIDYSCFFLVKSQFIKNQVVQQLGINEQRLAVIPNAPASNYYPLPERTKREAKKKTAHITGDMPFILYTGTIEPRKNLKVLFDAFKVIAEKYSVNLIIAGGLGWLYYNILNYPKEIGIKNTVKFLGYASEETLLHLFNLCEMFVFPSWYEGFGMPPLEAMSCGAVPIVSSSSSLPEVVGDCGLLFDPSSAEDLAEKMEFLLNNKELRDELSGRCIKRAKRYNWDVIVSQVVDIYKRVALND